VDCKELGGRSEEVKRLSHSPLHVYQQKPRMTLKQASGVRLASFHHIHTQLLIVSKYAVDLLIKKLAGIICFCDSTKDPRASTIL